MSPRACISLGGVLGAIGVTAGALGAHLLRSQLSGAQLESYETAVNYQILHAIALVIVGLLLGARPSTAGQIAAWAFLAGVLLFSGGIYVWLLSGAGGLVHVVPFGGVSLIAGWIAVAFQGIGWRPH